MQTESYRVNAAEAFVDHLATVSSESVMQVIWNGLAEFDIEDGGSFTGSVIEFAQSKAGASDVIGISDAAFQILCDRIDAVIQILPPQYQEEARDLFCGIEEWFPHEGGSCQTTLRA